MGRLGGCEGRPRWLLREVVPRACIDEGVVVRVVAVRERRALGWAVSVVGAAATIAILLGAFRPGEALGVSRFWTFGIACATWALGTLLEWRVPPRVTTAQVARGALHLGRAQIPLRRVRGVKVARGGRGLSVAVATGGGGGVFLEVERELDARRLVEKLGATWPGTEACTVAVRGELQRLVQQLAAAVGIASALSYAVAMGVLDAFDVRGLLGIPALAAATVASLLFVVERPLRSVVRVGDGSMDGRDLISEHLRLHVASPVAAAPQDAAEPRARALDQGEETTRAWLERVDGVGADAKAYRSDAPTADELCAIADDDGAPPQARLGALRLLARRFGGVPAALEARVASDLGQRVRVVLEADASVEDVAADLEALGPAFRLRS